MAEYAYIRVSTKEQNIDRQMMALSGWSIPPENIFCDWQSGKDFKRPAYEKMIRKLKANDVIVVKSIDRLGRNYNEILLQWQHITKDIGADIVVLDMELLDTRKKQDNLTGTLIADLVLQIFAYVAQTEREMIHQRQAEGIAAAKARGIKCGRPVTDLPEDFHDVAASVTKGEVSMRKAADILGMPFSTFYKKYRDNI